MEHSQDTVQIILYTLEHIQSWGKRTVKATHLLPLTALLVFSAFLLVTPKVSANLPIFDAGGSGYPYLTVSLSSETDLLESGKELQMLAVVTDDHGTPIMGAMVTVLADGASAEPTSGLTSLDGRFEFTYTTRSMVERHLLLVVGASKQGAYNGAGQMVIIVTPPPPSGVGQIAIAPAIGLAFLSTIGVASTEYGKYSLFKFLVFPLYSRIKKEEVLDHFVRGQIYGYIRANPGVHFNMLRSSLRVNNGTLAHHLRTLEMQGFVKSRRDGMFRRFYAVDVNIADDGIRLSDLQMKILDMITLDGATQAEIAERLGISQQAVSYNLRMMGREGMILVERTGREHRYHAAEA